jgi:glycosyltransferase involved in cell wall biosynthesis
VALKKLQDFIETMTGRVLFLVPGIHSPGGGTKVFFQFITCMRDAGVQAAPVYNNARYRYIYSDYSGESYYLPDLAFWPENVSLKTRLKFRWEWRVRPPFLSKTPHPQLELREDDVIVHPEFVYDLTTCRFPRNRNVLLAQDVFGLLRAHARSVQGGRHEAVPMEGVITTSEASTATAAYLGYKNIGRVPLTVEAAPIESLDAPKKKQIAFMMRKRPDDIALMRLLLQGDPALSDYSLVPIDRVSNDELRKILRDSLFFLSFSRQEGFGLPPAEAMAAGCITVGFTGVGGEEYFTPENGFPIKDGDIVDFAQTISNLAKEYDRDPTRLDDLRMAAAKNIRARYSEDSTRAALLAYWKEFGI